MRHILGITAGYNGLSDPAKHPPVELTEKMVRDIHMKGGSIIKAARRIGRLAAGFWVFCKPFEKGRCLGGTPNVQSRTDSGYNRIVAVL